MAEPPTPTAHPPTPAVLCIADGWGVAPAGPGNAIAQARTPTLDGLGQEAASTVVAAHGPAVGLPPGQQGNSEVGHLTIGAGRVVLQDLTRIQAALEDQSFFSNPALVAAIGAARQRGRTVHLLGLISPGGVHSHTDHVLAVAELCRRLGQTDVQLHAFLDGRDTAPTSGLGFLAAARDRLRAIGVGRIASIGGRYFAMDRDRRWERLARAYAVIVGPGGPVVPDAIAYVERQYEAGVGDEFIPPARVVDGSAPPSRVAPGDTVIHCNFRPDRARELVHALVDPTFDGFARGPRVEPLTVVTFTPYAQELDVGVVFPKPDVPQTLGAVVADAGLTQFHVAETEKYAHVTYFINGGREAPLPGEERLLIPSATVATYDRAPTMRAQAIAQAVVDRVTTGGDGLIIVNFANADMVGHTGDLAATVTAVEAVDQGVGAILAACRRAGTLLCFTADHGNAEVMVDPAAGGPFTAHTTNPVPLILAAPRAGGPPGRLAAGGGLRDVAPTLLAAMGLARPAAMTGRDLRAAIGDAPPAGSPPAQAGPRRERDRSRARRSRRPVQ